MQTGHKKNTQKTERRDAILQAAWSLIRQNGYHKTTVDEIAKGAGIAKGTIYLYFESKEEIMLALVDLTNLKIAKEQDKILASRLSAEKKLRSVILHRVLTLFDVVDRYPRGEEMVSSLLPHIVHRLDWYVRRNGILLAKIISLGCEDGNFEQDDHDAAGQMLARLFEHITPPYYRFDSRENLERFTNQLLDMLLAGLRSKTRLKGEK